MGVTFTLILAHEDDLERTLIWDGFPESDIVFTKMLDAVTMADVHILLLGGELDATIDRYLTNVLESDADQWVCEIPCEFVAALARLEDVERRRVGRLWTEYEEITILKLPNAEAFIQELLKDMQILAIRALLENKKLYLRSAL
ncbi:MAG: hypothetical protein K8L91_32270 [Anaerolineae bacterium]|nr:hypothetical protein [Anaerolineae bacterium]